MANSGNKNHPSVYGCPRWVPLPIATAPAHSSSLGWEISCMAAWWQHLQSSQHGSPWHPQGGGGAHNALASLAEVTSVVLPDSQPTDGEPTLSPRMSQVGAQYSEPFTGFPHHPHSQGSIHTPAAEWLQRGFANPLFTQVLATSPPITGCQHPRVTSLK